MHTTTKQIPSIDFNVVKDEKLFNLVKIEREKNKKKDFIKIDNLKKESKYFVHQG